MDEPLLSNANRSSLLLLRERLAQIQDRRQAGCVKHQLADVLGCAMICGFGDFTAMATFARYRLDWLRHFLSLENGAPSHDTFRNVFMAIDADALADVLIGWCSKLADKHVAIDGKALRGTFDRDAGKCLVHLLRAWVDDVSLSVGQVACSSKSNESERSGDRLPQAARRASEASQIEAIPRLLASLQIRGATVTIDAAGCQSAIAEQIDGAGGRYILALKGNQGNAHDTVRTHMQGLQRPADVATEEKAHGRYEKRECWMEADLSFFHKSWKCRAQPVLPTGHGLVHDMLRSQPSKGTLPNKRQRALLDPNFRAEIIASFHA